MSPSLYFALGLIQAFEAVQGTIMVSIFPYIVAEFYTKSEPLITEKELNARVGQGSGYLAGSFFLAAFLSSFLWGWASDRIGRRPVLLIGVGASIIATVLFAVADTFLYALATRFLIGLLNGNLGVLKTYLGEVTTSENQASAFAFVAVVYAAMTVISPLAGGILGGKLPGMPFAFLPGIISAVIGVIVFVLCLILLPETTAFLNRQRPQPSIAQNQPSASSIRVLIRDRAIMLATVSYSSVCFVHIAIITMLPIFFRAPIRSGGLGMPSSEVGALFAIEGAVLCLFQMLCFPKLAKRFGIVALLRTTSLLLSGSLLLPLVCLYTTGYFAVVGHWATTVPVMAIVGLPTTVCFTCTNLLVNNSALNEIRGAVNGFGMMLGCVSRSVGPVVIGTLWSVADAMDAPYIPFLALFVMSFALYGLAVLIPPHLLHPRDAGRARPAAKSEVELVVDPVR